MDERMKQAIVEWERMLAGALDLKPAEHMQFWGRIHQLWGEVKAVARDDMDRYELLRSERKPEWIGG